MLQKHCIAVVCLCLCVSSVYPQKYITAGGLRISKNELGISLQQKLLEHTTLEILAVTNLEEYYITVMPEFHNNILWGDGFNTYWGAGPRFGVQEYDSTYFGGDIVFGLEYKMLLFPIVFSADIKPGFRFQQDNWFELGAGISFRYIFIKEKKKKLFDGNKNK